LGWLGYPFLCRPEPLPLPLENEGGRQGRIMLLAGLREFVARVLPPGAQVLPVGSFAWGIDTDGSDLDVVLSAPGGGEADPALLELLEEAIATKAGGCEAEKDADGAGGGVPDVLRGAPVVLRGRGTGIAVLTIFATVNGQPLSADVCCAGQLSSVRDALLFRHMIARAPRLRPTLQLFKRWLQVRSVPTSSSGCFPQVYWMRLAARTFQLAETQGVRSQSGPAIEGGLGERRAMPGSQVEAFKALRSPPAAFPARATKGAPACETTEESAGAENPKVNSGDNFNMVREQLASFCGCWSLALPGWGDPLNLLGEDVMPQLRRLGAGVYGATALLCLREMREMWTQSSAATRGRQQSLDPVPPHQYLCPAEAGFWGAFLVPDMNGGGDCEEAAENCRGAHRLVAAFVWHAEGPEDAVRLCVCPSCCPTSNGSMTAASMSHGQGIALPEATSPNACVSGVAGRAPQEYVSRRDSEWTFWAWPLQTPGFLEPVDVPERRPLPVGLLDRSPPVLTLSPPHLVARLLGDPRRDERTCMEFAMFQHILASPGAALSLPPVYPTSRYSRRVLLNARRREFRASTAASACAVAAGGCWAPKANV